MKKAQLILLILVFMICSCGQEVQKLSPQPDDHPYKPVSNVPHTQTIGMYNFRLEAYLWRDFMPGTPQNGEHLYSIISLVETANNSIKGKFELQKFIIAASEGTWEPTFLSDTVSGNLYEVKKISHDGPQLEPGRFVDVIGTFKSLETGKIYEILASRQEIKRSD